MIIKNRIVVITDCKDIAFNEIRGSILRELDKLKKPNNLEVEVEPPVFAEEFSLINGAFLTRLVAESYQPKLTTFLVILNPLKTNRIDRARIIGETKNGFKFVGENTGTLGWLVKDFGIKEIFESEKKGLDGKEFISFGGKYIHAPIAARVALGSSLSTIGRYFDPKRFTYLDLKPGTVVHIDNFGVPKIFAKIDNLGNGQKVMIYINGRKAKEAIFTNSMKNLPDGTWALYRGSSLDSLPEIGKVRSLSTSTELNTEIGDIVTWKAS